MPAAYARTTDTDNRLLARSRLRIPLIGKIPDVQDAYVATGHSVWGMLNGPETGEAITEVIADGQTGTVDLTPFNPALLPDYR